MAVLNEFHDSLNAGHLGIRKTFSKIQAVCFFPSLRRFVVNYVRTCRVCQFHNYNNQKPAGNLIPVLVHFPLEKLAVDLLGPYPLTRKNKYRYIFVITDVFSKWVDLTPLKKASAQAVSDAFLKFIYTFGAPLAVVSDNGAQFISNIFTRICCRFDIRHIFISPYRPQGNQAERVNRNIVQMLGAFVGQNHRSWDEYVEPIAYALRTAVHDSTKKTPAELFLGRKILTPFESMFYVNELESRYSLQNVREEIAIAVQNVTKAQQMQAKYYDKKRREAIFVEGEEVLKMKHTLSNLSEGIMAKFADKYEGPYLIKEVRNNVVKLERGNEIVSANIDQIKKYYDRTKNSFLKEYLEGNFTFFSETMLSSEQLQVARVDQNDLINFDSFRWGCDSESEQCNSANERGDSVSETMNNVFEEIEAELVPNVNDELVQQQSSSEAVWKPQPGCSWEKQAVPLETLEPLEPPQPEVNEPCLQLVPRRRRRRSRIPLPIATRNLRSRTKAVVTLIELVRSSRSGPLVQLKVPSWQPDFLADTDLVFQISSISFL